VKFKNARRYAYALFQVAQEAGQVDETGDLLNSLLPLADKGAVTFLKNPFVNSDKKTALIDETYPDLPAHVRDFAGLLLIKREFNLLPEIAARYQELRCAAQNVLNAEVFSPVPLEDSALESLRKSVEKFTGRSVVIEGKHDPALIGGIVIKAGDLRIDGSIRGKLNLLKRELCDEI
jgi:F-type H+-transporting ATPase subunit delta